MVEKITSPRLLPFLSITAVVATAALALVVGRFALLVICLAGLHSVLSGSILLRRPEAWDRFVAWRETAPGLALWAAGLTRNASHESRTVAAVLRITVGVGFVVLGAAGAAGTFS